MNINKLKRDYSATGRWDQANSTDVPDILEKAAGPAGYFFFFPFVC